MAADPTAARASLIDVLDRVLDKGIVIDAYVRVAVIGIDLVTVEARVVVAALRTYLDYADALGFRASPVLAGSLEPGEEPEEQSESE